MNDQEISLAIAEAMEPKLAELMGESPVKP